MSYSTSTATSITPASVATPALTYKQLQAKLKELKAAGHDVQCKLNSKHEILLAEFQRLTAVLEQEVLQALDGQTALELPDVEPRISTSSSYPFSSNTVKVPNRPELCCYSTRVLPAMNRKLAPSWLAQPQKVYIIDGIDYLPHELNHALVGQTCELTCDVMNYQQTELTCEVPKVEIPVVEIKPELPSQAAVFPALPVIENEYLRVFVPFIHALLVIAFVVREFWIGFSSVTSESAVTSSSGSKTSAASSASSSSSSG